MDFRIGRKFAARVAAAVLIGLAITHWQVAFILSLAVPAIALSQATRIGATAVAFAYYAGAIWLVIPTANAFFGPNAGSIDGIGIWLCGAALLSVPYALLWSATRRFIGWRSLAAVLMSVPPPLGIIGVASPLTAAGLLFPGTGWLGLLATLAAIAALATRRDALIIPLTAVAIGCNLTYPGTTAPPTDWEAVDTTFGDVGRSAEAEIGALSFIQRRALASRAHVIIFPETVVPRWTEATDMFWETTINKLARSGKTVLIGTTFDVPGQPGYNNGVVIRGSETGIFLQHIPVPIGMWNPIDASSAQLKLKAQRVVEIHGHRTAIFLCYEQLLTWPILTAIVSGPAVIVGMSNTRWVERTALPDLQKSQLTLWARLIGAQAVCARNR